MPALSLLLVLLTLLENVLTQSSKQAPVIVKQPSNTYATKGGIAVLSCTASGTPPLRYEWFHKNKRIRPGKTGRRNILSNGDLYFTRVLHKKRKGSDTGSYYCMVSNNFGTVKSNVVNITLGYLRDSFRKHPNSQSVITGGTLTLSCIPPRGRPKPVLKWLKDGNFVVADDKKTFLENRNQRLVINSFQKDDEGSYQCEATNVVGRKLSNRADIVGLSPPVFVETPKDQIVAAGVDRRVSFRCQAGGNPKPTVEWRKDGNDTVLPSNNGELVLDDLKISDAGTYICFASNLEGTVSRTARLTVNYAPVFTVVSPDAYHPEGSTVKLSCLANAQPAPSILWFNNDTGEYYKPHETYGNIRVNQDDRTVILVISNLQQSDKGTYTCQATNEIGSRSRPVNLMVHSRLESSPIISSSNRSHVTADINGNLRLICDVFANPKPEVLWLRDGHGKDLGGGTSVSSLQRGSDNYRYVLRIDKVRQSNAGTFRCHAINRIGGRSRDFVLQVTNKLQLAQPIGVGVPPMPTGLMVVDWKEDSVLIRWNKITATSAVEPVVRFAVGYINVDERRVESYVSFDILPSRTQFMVEKLQPDTRYRFFVRVINKNGAGPPSLLSDIVTTDATATTTPVSPQVIKVPYIRLKIRARQANPGELVVRWKKLDNYAPFDGYYIYCKTVRGREWRETLLSNRVQSYTVTELQNSTAYEVRVQVFKGAVTGLRSNVVKQRTSEEPVVLRMSVRRNDTDSFVVTWERLWKKWTGRDKVVNYSIWYMLANSKDDKHREFVSPGGKREFIVAGLTPGEDYRVWMVATTRNGHQYFSKERNINILQAVIPGSPASKTLAQQIKTFVLQAWFLGLLGGIVVLLVLFIVFCCCCKRSSSKNDDLPIPLQDRQKFEVIRKPPSDAGNTESDVTSRSQGRESCSDGDNLTVGRLGRDYRGRNGSPSVSTPTSLDFPQVAITPNRLYSDPRAKDEANSYGRSPRGYLGDFDSPSSRYNSRARNPYSPSPKLTNHSTDTPDPSKSKYPSSSSRSPTHSTPYSDAPPDYETAIAEKTPLSDKDEQNDDRSVASKDHVRTPVQKDRYGNPLSRQSSRSPGSESSNQGSSIAGRRKGLKPLPRLTIASVNWADMLPPPPSHPPPSSVATRSPPPSPTATSMCSETTYGRSHASSFLPRRSASVVSGDMTSDLEKATADSVLSGKSRGKSENKLPFDLAGITSDIIMQWADSVTNTSGSDNESQCSSPSRISGISSDGSFLTDTDFANAVKAAAECGGFNIDIDLNMYKDMDPISFQPFAGSLSTYNPDNSTETPSKESKLNKMSSRDNPRSGRSRRPRNAPAAMAIDSRLPSSFMKETSPLMTPTADPANKSPRKSNEMNGNGTGYVPALTRTSALGQLEPVNRGPVKKKYAVVKTLPQVQPDETPEFPGNYPSHSLSSSTSNASTIRSSSCPPTNMSDDDIDDDTLS